MKPKTLHYQCDGGQSSGSSSPSPPHSPPRYASKGRRKLRSKPHYYLPLRELFVGGFNFRFSFRHMVLLPLLYISGLIMCVGPFSSFGGQPSPPGSLYRSHRMYHLLRRHIQSDNSSAIQVRSSSTSFFFFFLWVFTEMVESFRTWGICSCSFNDLFMCCVAVTLLKCV